MSKPALREVEYVTEGRLVRTITDAETARAIGMYKDTCNKIHSFNISAHTLPAKNEGFVCEALVADSRTIQIICFKEYKPNIPEIVCRPMYQCGILNKKSREIQSVSNAIPELYFKLLREHVK